jgi:hypothetical protein
MFHVCTKRRQLEDVTSEMIIGFANNKAKSKYFLKNLFSSMYSRADNKVLFDVQN